MPEHGDTQPSVVEYARFHGLAVEHLKQDIHRYFHSHTLKPVEDGILPKLKLPHAGTIPSEPKFKLDSKSAYLLASSLKPLPAPEWSNMLSDYRQIKTLKLELPVLTTDHEADMNRIRSRKPRKLEPLNLMPIEIDEDLAWPLEMKNLTAIWDKKLADEKLQTTREVLKTLQDTLRPVHTSQMHEAIIAEDLAYSKRLRLQPISPPLLPFEDDQEPYIPSSPALHMPLLSDGPNPDEERMQQVTEDISNQSRIEIENALPADVDQVDKLLQLAEHGPAIDELVSLELSEPTLAKEKQHPKLLKLESPDVQPLTPPKPCIKSDARVTFAADLENLIPEQMRCEDPDSGLDDQPFKDELFAQLAHEAAQAVDRGLGSEKLERADITMRVKVPELRDVNFPLAEVSTTSGEFLQTMIRDHLQHTRQRFDKADERRMKWAPIPSKSFKPVIEESVDPPSQLGVWISQPSLTVTSKDLLWRPEKLRILRFNEESDEEELEEDSSLKDDPAKESQLPAKRPGPKDLEDFFSQRQPRQVSVPVASRDSSGFGSLAGFMDTRKAFKKPRLEAKAESNKFVQATTICITEDKSEDKSTSVAQIQVPATPTTSSVANVATLPLPQLPKDTSPHTIIVSSRLLKSHRHLVRSLETCQEPALTIIYRDLVNPDEPDIILSPTFAAIFTTLQATTQRSLPGQDLSHPPIFKRIIHLTQLYDRLFILTALPPSTDTSPLFSSTSPTYSQISSLTSFCASLSQPYSDCLVQAILIPTPTSPPSSTTTTKPKLLNTSANPDPLVQWTYFLIHKHALNPTTTTTSSSSISQSTLLPEQTLWELFLLKAGLNPYAAQIVLSVLKKPTSPISPSSSSATTEQNIRGKGGARLELWGLRAFVQMSREERLRLFEGVLGRRAVERVSDVLDGGVGWVGVLGEGVDERGGGGCWWSDDVI